MFEMPTLSSHYLANSSGTLHERPARVDWLNPVVLKSWLAEAITWPKDARLDHVQVSRLWAGRRGRIRFELALHIDIDSSRAVGLLQGALGESPNRRAHLDAKFSRSTLLGLRLWNENLGVWFCTPDRDHKLPIVRRLLHDDSLREILATSQSASRLGLDDTAAGLSSRIVAYRMNKRCTLHIRRRDESSKAGVFLKVLHRPPTDDQIGAVRELAVYFERASDGRIRIPRVLDFLPEHKILMTAAAHEPTVRLGISPPELAAAAEALCILHRAEFGSTQTHSPGDEVEIVRRWVDTLRLIEGASCDDLGNLAEELEKRVTTIDESARTLVHRDFYSAQLVRSGEKLWMVDFDTLCQGHPEVDISTFAAHVLLDNIMEGATTSSAMDRAASFFERYREHGGQVDPQRLRFYFLSATARLGAIHSARGLPVEVVRQLWTLGRQYAESG